MDITRRQALAGTASSLAGLALPGPPWWDDAHHQVRTRPPASARVVGAADVEAIREMTAFFSRHDQRRGGADGRPAVVAHLRSSVAAVLSATFPSEDLRRDLFSAAAELTYLSGWMAFDALPHEPPAPRLPEGLPSPPGRSQPRHDHPLALLATAAGSRTSPPTDTNGERRLHVPTAAAWQLRTILYEHGRVDGLA
ncbi:hypothetical protein [Streptomyces sp. NPDC008001]|uniref:hypothetical protein n=1 Tax=Streptomyces sp. NPDC008001 TaxID=3364804 RepID=UPI0036E4CA3F